MRNLVTTYRCLPLLITVIAMVLTAPLMRERWEIGLAFGILWSVLIGISGYLIYSTPGWLKIYTPLVAVAVVIHAVNSSLDRPVWSSVLLTVFILAIEGLALFAVMRHALFAKVRHELDRVLGAISGYFLIALMWSRVFELVILADPGAIEDRGVPIVFGEDSTLLYYSLVTLTTIGYGEVIPVDDYARLLSGIEGTIGTLYIAVVIASLIGRLIAGAARKSA